MRYRFIKEHEKQFQSAVMCQALRVSRSGYYAWQNREESSRSRENKRLLVEIKAVHKKSRGTYGSPRVYRQLRKAGETCSRGRVARLMRAAGIAAKHKRKYVATTDSRHSLPIAANLLERRFQADTPNKVWLSDITYIPTHEGWLYLSAVMDLHSRYIAGWSMREDMESGLVMGALNMAYRRRKPAPGLLHHTDRGRQYASKDYKQLLSEYGMQQSMSGKGDCYDNAPMESFFHTLKTELVHQRRYRSREEAKREIFEYIEVFYNRQRLHSSLDYCSPAEFEALNQEVPVH